MPSQTRGKPEQVNLGLAAEDHDVLLALAFVRQTSGAAILRPVVESFLRDQRTTPAVELALKALEEARESSEPSQG